MRALPFKYFCLMLNHQLKFTMAKTRHLIYFHLFLVFITALHHPPPYYLPLTAVGVLMPYWATFFFFSHFCLSHNLKQSWQTPLIMLLSLYRALPCVYFMLFPTEISQEDFTPRSTDISIPVVKDSVLTLYINSIYLSSLITIWIKVT